MIKKLRIKFIAIMMSIVILILLIVFIAIDTRQLCRFVPCFLLQFTLPKQ